MGKPKNMLGALYKSQPRPVKAQFLEDLRMAGISHQNFYNWTVKPDEKLRKMPTYLKAIVCANIPEAEELFVLRIRGASGLSLVDRV